MKEYWDDTTDALCSDICDLLAQHLKSAIEEKPPYVKFEGQDVTAHNPGWLNAALVAVEMVCDVDNVSQNLKQVLIDLRVKVEEILAATQRIIEDTENNDDFNDTLLGLEELYRDLSNRLNII